MEFNAYMRLYAEDALLGLLAPIWQIVISVCLVLVTAVAGVKLFLRGPSSMSRGIVLAGGAIVGVIVVGLLFSMA